jgi:hypothetical protein
VGAQGRTEPENRPIAARRTLLTGGAIGLAAAAAATLGGAQSASAGTQALTWITPTNDKMGNQDTAAIQGALNPPGFVWLAPGDFYVNTTISVPNQATLQGSGPLTRIHYLGTGACLNMHDPSKDGADPEKNSSGSLRDFFIDGTSAVGTAYGIDVGDGWAYRLDHLFVDNFTAPGSVGLRLVNNAFFTEKLVAAAVTIRNCTTQVLIHQGTGDNSFEYCDLAFYLAIHPGQDGLVIDNGADLAGGSLMIRGNTYSQMDSASQGYVIRVGADTSGSGDGSTINSCRLDVAIEQNNFVSGYSYVPGTVFFSGSSNTMLNDYGMLAFRDMPWTLSNVTKGQFAFRGILYGDANLIANNQVPTGWV